MAGKRKIRKGKLYQAVVSKMEHPKLPIRGREGKKNQLKWGRLKKSKAKTWALSVGLAKKSRRGKKMYRSIGKTGKVEFLACRPR